jgi:hypothetical protein
MKINHTAMTIPLPATAAVAFSAAGIALALPLGPPSPGDECMYWHAHTQVAYGRTLTCVHVPQDDSVTYWEYGGFTDTQD